MRWILLAGIVSLTLVVACEEDGETSPTTTAALGGSGGAAGAGGVGGSGGEPVCGSANLPLDTTGLTELSHDDGVPATHVREQTFAITISSTKSYVFNEERLYEAVRFELEHPARILGFQVMWAGLPDGIDPKAQLEAGLYANFGYNGFDFWAPDPLWTGTRCAEDVDASGEWLSYTLDQPVEISHPGLVYVAHEALPGNPVWWFDNTVEGMDPDSLCAVFGECQSALNLPEAELQTYYNGMSFPFQYHYMVRLLVEYTDNVQPADKIFQEILNSPSRNHVSFVDYDSDGWDDLLLGPKLWKNNGDGSFTDVTVSSGLDGLSGTGGIFGDYDNDGCLDLFLFSESLANSDTLLKSNCDGTFSVDSAAGIVDNQTYEQCGDPNNTVSPTAAAAWFDLDSDGYLDLYQANFICWAQERFYVDTVWRNDGDGTFTEITATQGFNARKLASRTVEPIDHDGDGDVDLFTGSYRLQKNQFFENNGDGTVTERAILAGLAGTINGGYYGHTIGAAWGDLDNDGDFDQIAANLAHPRFFDFSDKTQVLINDGNGIYSDLSGDWMTPFVSPAGLRYQETHSVPALGDFNNDGNLDLAITCIYDGRPSDFYWGNGDGTFTLDAYHAGITTQNGWGMASADHDGDGDLDLFASTLFENTLADADKGHYLSVRAVGVTSNWAAIGATVKVTSGNTTRIRHVQGGTGKGGQDSLYLHFGLGADTTVDQISVTYPGGNTVTYTGPIAVDQRVWLFEDSTTPQVSWAKP